MHLSESTEESRQGFGFNGINLAHTDLSNAILFGSFGHFLNRSDPMPSNFREANLTGADLRGAWLVGVGFSHADLTNTNFREAFLNNVDFNSANLQGADLGFATLGFSSFPNVDLRGVKGLDTARHLRPSTIGIDTVIRSEGKIPEQFLRGAGVPDEFITYGRSLVTRPIEFYSCFISYSSKDQGFAERLHADLQIRGVRCWFAPQDLKIGQKIRVGIDESIRKHDKVLLIISKHSVESEWVEKEVETAIELERNQKRAVLFPIRLDDTVLKIEGGWPSDIRRTRNIGDFRRWRNHDSYQKALDRLIRDLKADENKRPN